MDKEEKLLKEYELCQKENTEQSHSYWTIFGTFVSLNVALLGGLAYGLVTKFMTSVSNPLKVPETLIIIFIALIVGGGVVTITVLLKLWLERANFLIRSNYKRIHAIEARLSMFSSLQVHIVDKWNEIKAKRKLTNDFSNVQKEEVLAEIWKELEDELTKEDLDLIKNNYRDIIIKSCTSPWPKYVRPARKVASFIFWIVCLIWTFLTAFVISIFLYETMHLWTILFLIVIGFILYYLFKVLVLKE